MNTYFAYQKYIWHLDPQCLSKETSVNLCPGPQVQLFLSFYHLAF